MLKQLLTISCVLWIVGVATADLLSASEQNAILVAHNDARRDVTPVPATPLVPLVWSNQLATLASQWLDSCVWGHSPGGPAAGFSYVGENLAQNGKSPSAGGPAFAVGQWVGERANYHHFRDVDRCDGGWSQCGHFTQVMWEKTTHVGCAYSSGNCGGSLDPHTYICQYGPAGNVWDPAVNAPKRPYVALPAGTPPPVAPTPPAGAVGGYQKTAGISCGLSDAASQVGTFIGPNGQRWMSATANDIDACKQTCDQHATCGGFNFIKSGTYGQRCYFRSDATVGHSANAERDCYVKIVPYELTAGISCGLSDAASRVGTFIGPNGDRWMSATANDIDACKQTCDQHATCGGFNYIKSGTYGQRCYFRSDATVGHSANAERDCYVKAGSTASQVGLPSLAGNVDGLTSSGGLSMVLPATVFVLVGAVVAALVKRRSNAKHEEALYEEMVAEDL